jgi:hypothetical protein
VRSDMEFWRDVRRQVLTGELSRRGACRKYGLGWHTLKKILCHEEPPGYRQSEPRPKRKLEPFLPIIHQILTDDGQAPKKQRHTARRIFERLRDEHGYQGGHTVVKDAVRAWKQSCQEVFLPLSHPPGEAQVDFGEATIRLAGQETKVALFVMTLPYSGAISIQVFPLGSPTGASPLLSPSCVPLSASATFPVRRKNSPCRNGRFRPGRETARTTTSPIRLPRAMAAAGVPLDKTRCRLWSPSSICSRRERLRLLCDLPLPLLNLPCELPSLIPSYSQTVPHIGRGIPLLDLIQKIGDLSIKFAKLILRRLQLARYLRLRSLPFPQRCLVNLLSP